MMEHKAMMSDAEVKIIEGLLKPDFEVLEFGSGYSTCYFPQFVKHWTSIEHDEDWYYKVRAFADFNVKNTTLILADKFSYLNAAARVNKKFDLILIDGEKREECLDMSWQLIAKDGIILLHDSSRYEYKNWIDKYKGKVLCDGEMPDERVPGYCLIRGLKLWRSTFA